MVVLDDFQLLKGNKNVLDLLPKEIIDLNVEDAKDLMQRSLEIREKRISHFTKNQVYKTITGDKVKVIYYPSYILPVGYNYPTKDIILNLAAAPFQTQDVSRIDSKNIYAGLVYGICFRELVERHVDVKLSLFTPVSNFLLSLFIKMFGKDYGLIGVYSTEIPWLKFAISTYVLYSFFGMTDITKCYMTAATISSVNYKDKLDKLQHCDFSNINGFTKALSTLEVMPDFDRYRFTAKVVRSLSLNFLPAFEDLSRFISICTTSCISGSNIVPTYIKSFNPSEYDKILEISKSIFR